MNVLPSHGIVKDALKDRYAVFFVISLYVCMYSVSLLARISDVEFMGVDERSIINSLHGLFSGPLYNMNEQYHSKVYGWTYFSINFMVISPLKLLQVESSLVYNIVIRGVLFLIGMAASITFYVISRKFFNRIIALLITVYFLTHPVISYFFLNIHPESTGLLFYFFGLYCLLEYFSTSNKQLCLYIFGLIFFWLSALSKQPFAVLTVFTFILFPVHYLKSRRLTISACIGQKSTWVLLALSIAIAFLILLVVHPYSILDFPSFLEGQLRPLSHSTARTLEDAAALWYSQLKNHPIVLINFSLVILLPFGRILRFQPLFIYSLVASCASTLLFMYMQKRFVNVNYLYPIYPLFIWNIAYVLQALFLRRFSENQRLVVGFLALPLVLLCGQNIVLNTLESAYSAYARYQMDGSSTKNQSYTFINFLPSETRLLYMPTVAVPDKYKANSCHVWRNCNSVSGMAEFAPEYIFVSWGYQHFNPEVLDNYMTTEKYELVHEYRGGSTLNDKCGLPKYKLKRQLEKRQNKDRMDHRKELQRSEYSVFENLSYQSNHRRIEDCLSRFDEVSRIKGSGKYVGHDIEVWKRVN